MARITAVLLCLGMTGCTHGGGAAGQVSLAAWSVPAGNLTARIQVRLAPRIDIPSAILTATSPRRDIQFQPARFTLNNLSPPSYPKNKTHNPPALGKTILRTFSVFAARPGDYVVQVHLHWNGHVESQELILHFTKAHTP